MWYKWLFFIIIDFILICSTYVLVRFLIILSVWFKFYKYIMSQVDLIHKSIDYQHDFVFSCIVDSVVIFFVFHRLREKCILTMEKSELDLVVVDRF